MDLTTSTKAADEATLDAGKIKLGAAMRVPGRRHG